MKMNHPKESLNEWHQCAKVTMDTIKELKKDPERWAKLRAENEAVAKQNSQPINPKTPVN
jgi:hypothetical protein